jgi:gluconolactonase
VITTRGGIYFTDFPYTPPPAGTPSLAPAVYYIPPGGKPMKIADGIDRPNGIQLSRDEKTLYVNNNSEWMLAFDINADGSVKNRRIFAHYEGLQKPANGGNPVSAADGLAIDNAGHIFAATNVGLQVYDDKGKYLGTITLSRVPQNLAFAGPDKKTLYIVGRGVAFKIAMLTEGFKGRPK